jgi:hypothetical protein
MGIEFCLCSWWQLAALSVLAGTFLAGGRSADVAALTQKPHNHQPPNTQQLPAGKARRDGSYHSSSRLSGRVAPRSVSVPATRRSTGWTTPTNERWAFPSKDHANPLDRFASRPCASLRWEEDCDAPSTLAEGSTCQETDNRHSPWTHSIRAAGKRHTASSSHLHSTVRPQNASDCERLQLGGGASPVKDGG